MTLLKITTSHKMKFSIKDLFSKGDQIDRKLRIWSHLLKKSLTLSIYTFFRKTFMYTQKQPLEVIYNKRYSQKFCEFDRNTPVAESLFLIKLETWGLIPATYLQEYLFYRILSDDCFCIHSTTNKVTWHDFYNPFLRNVSFWLPLQTCRWCRSGVFIVNLEYWRDFVVFNANLFNLEHIPHLLLIFEQVNDNWDVTCQYFSAMTVVNELKMFMVGICKKWFMSASAHRSSQHKFTAKICIKIYLTIREHIHIQF